jgi:hypothetical protein
MITGIGTPSSQSKIPRPIEGTSIVSRDWITLPFQAAVSASKRFAARLVPDRRYFSAASHAISASQPCCQRKGTADAPGALIG